MVNNIYKYFQKNKIKIINISSFFNDILSLFVKYYFIILYFIILILTTIGQNLSSIFNKKFKTFKQDFITIKIVFLFCFFIKNLL